MFHICIIYPQNSVYGVLDAFSDSIARAFEQKGCTVTPYYVDPQRSIQDRIVDIREIAPDVTFYFNSLGQIEGHGYLSDHTDIPHVAYLVDSPYRFLPFEPSPRNLVACVDGYDQVFFSHLCGQDPAIHLPHGTDESYATPADAPRKHDVVFLGTCIDSQALWAQWKKELLPSQLRQLEAMIERVTDDRSLYYWQAVVEECPKGSIEELALLWEYLEIYVRGEDRLEMLRAVKDLDVHVFGGSYGGRSWKQVFADEDLPIATYGELSFNDAVKVLQDARIVLNSCPTYKKGGHERLFAAMAAGAMVLTDECPFMWDNFAPGEHLLLYEPEHWNLLAEELEETLKDESERLFIASAGQKAVLEGHTWGHRVDVLLDEIPKLIGK